MNILAIKENGLFIFNTQSMRVFPWSPFCEIVENWLCLCQGYDNKKIPQLTST